MFFTLSVDPYKTIKAYSTLEQTQELNVGFLYLFPQILNVSPSRFPHSVRKYIYLYMKYFSS
jgi:hypothetical protein